MGALADTAVASFQLSHQRMCSGESAESEKQSGRAAVGAEEVATEEDEETDDGEEFLSLRCTSARRPERVKSDTMSLDGAPPDCF